MATSTTIPQSLVEQLMQTEGKAEIIGGKVVEYMSTGRKPIQASGRIYSALLSHAEATNSGEAVPDNAGFLCELPNRGSFSPDAAFYTGPDNPDSDMDFYPEPPVFAAEVRSKNEYSVKAERAIHAKIGDYFAAGTRVVWDVDLESEEVIAKYTAPDAVYPQIFRRGEAANAEPAVPGWTLNVDDLFPRARVKTIGLGATLLLRTREVRRCFRVGRIETRGNRNIGGEVERPGITSQFHCFCVTLPF